MNKNSLNLVLRALGVVLLFVFSQHSVAQLSTSKAAQKAHLRILADGGLYDNPKVAKYVSEVGQRIVDNSDHAGREYHFFVLDTPWIDAFTPGYGLVYISRGLLAKVNSEGELAGVLAHEIGHNVGRHLQRGKRKRVLGNVVAWTAAILAGSSSIADAINVSNSVRWTGFSRELELEADEYAAEYLYRSNYDPKEMLGVLNVLKNDAKYGQALSRARGGKVQHQGIWSTHPRTDKRLKYVVEQAGELPPGEGLVGRSELRDAIDGMVYGRNYKGNKLPNQERYLNESLSITFVYPEGWERKVKGSKIVLKNPEKTIQLKIDIAETTDRTKSSKELLTAKFPDELSAVELLGEVDKRDLGTMARRSEQRVALIKVARNSFHFQGIARNNKLTPEQDAELVKIIKSFRRPTPQDIPPEAITRIYYERLEPGQTFADLAKRYKNKGDIESELRLINGYYPKGEAEPGTWMKLIKLDPVSEKLRSSLE